MGVSNLCRHFLGPCLSLNRAAWEQLGLLLHWKTTLGSSVYFSPLKMKVFSLDKIWAN